MLWRLKNIQFGQFDRHQRNYTDRGKVSLNEVELSRSQNDYLFSQTINDEHIRILFKYSMYIRKPSARIQIDYCYNIV